MSVASAEGSRWETAVAILMLRHEMMTKPLNCQETKKIGALRGLGDLGITRKQSKEADAKKNMWVWAREGNEMTGRSSSEVAPRASPGR